jgi:hypothetical protein
MATKDGQKVCHSMIFVIGGLELFKGLLKSEFSEQNVELWITCEEFRCSGDANMHVFAQKIYGELGRHPLEINIKCRMLCFWSRLMTTEKLSSIKNNS